MGDNPNKDFQACRQLGMRWKYLKNEDGLYTDLANENSNNLDFNAVIDCLKGITQ